MKRTLNELQYLREILWKLDSIAGSNDIEAVKKEITNLIEIVEFNITNKHYVSGREEQKA